MVDAILKCDFQQDRLIVPEDLKAVEFKLYRYFQQAILDSHLPVRKAVGFALITPTKLYKQSATERCSYCLENMIEIASNLDDKLFIYDSRSNAVSDITSEPITANSTFTASANPVRLLYIQPDIITPINQMGIEIFVVQSSGYRTMEANSALMHNIKYFPMNSYHSLNDYVRVLPYQGEICYKLLHGLQPLDLKKIFADFAGMMKIGTLEGDDVDWAYNFVL